MSVLATSSCGGDEDDAALVGGWALERGDGCLVGLALGADNGYRHAVGCRLEGGDVGVERYEGSYSVDGETMEISLTHSTCPGEAIRYLVDYELTGDRLALNLPDARLIFERAEGAGSGNSVARNGCWDGDTLVFGSLRPLD